MDQHRDYDALLRHGGMPNGVPTAPSYAPHGHHAHGGMVPAHHAAPPDLHAIHETLGHMQREIAQMRHGPHPLHGGGHYVEEHRHPGPHQPQHQDYMRAPRPQPGREFPIGFMSKQVGPGQLAEMEVKPQVKFQGHRLAVDPRLARYFNIVDIKVGKDSQLAATGEMPASAFSALAVGTQMELDPAEPGIVITLIVRNDDASPQDFKAVLYGSVHEKD